jgi:CheY-like chemotaxis protein
MKDVRELNAEQKKQSENPLRIPLNQGVPTPMARDGAQNGHGGVGGRKVLTSWKEIAGYLGRGVRTVQRYEARFGLPVRRPAGTDRSGVMAVSDELDQWLNRAPLKQQRHVRRVLLVVDHPTQDTISSRKLVLEIGKFNVLTTFTPEETFETAEKFDVDAYVVDCSDGDPQGAEICESLKERHPQRPIFAVVAESSVNMHAPHCVDYVVKSSDPQELLAAVIDVFGPPRLE